MTEQIKKTMNRCKLFAGIDLDEVEALLDRIELGRFAKGQVIYSPQNYLHSLGILVRGKAKAEKGKGVLLNEFQEGDCFGVCALFSDKKEYAATITAKTDCEVWFISAEQMQELLLTCPQLALNYIKFLSDRIRFLNLRIDSFTASRAEEALLCYLRQRPDGRSEDVPMSKIAEGLNIGRTSLYRAVEHLESCGMIRKQGRVIELAYTNHFERNETTK